MRQKSNGFTSFMSKLEGTEPKESKPEFYYNLDGMLSVRPRGLADVLRGDWEDLWNAFTWRETPQGHDHWHSIAVGSQRASREDIEYIKWLMKEYP